MLKQSVEGARLAIEKDDVDAFYNSYTQYLQDEEENPDLENTSYFLNEMLDSGAINCYKKIVEENFPFEGEYLEHLRILHQKYKYIDTVKDKIKYFNFIDFIINNFEINVNELNIYQNDFVWPEIITILSAPEVLSLYLKQGLDIKKTVELKELNKESRFVPLEEALEILCRESSSLGYQESRSVLEIFKTARDEKEMLLKAIVQKNNIHKIEKI